jgi:hypothetical protein
MPVETGFDSHLTAVVAYTGVTQYLTARATLENMRLAADLAAGSVYVCSFILPAGELDEDDRKLVGFQSRGCDRARSPMVELLHAGRFRCLGGRGRIR